MQLTCRSPDACRALGSVLVSATHEGAYDFTVAGTLELTVRFGLFQVTSVTAYVTTDDRIIISVPPEGRSLLVFSDHDLWQLGASHSVIVKDLLATLRSPRACRTVEWNPRPGICPPTP